MNFSLLKIFETEEEANSAYVNSKDRISRGISPPPIFNPSKKRITKQEMVVDANNFISKEEFVEPQAASLLMKDNSTLENLLATRQEEEEYSGLHISSSSSSSFFGLDNFHRFSNAPSDMQYLVEEDNKTKNNYVIIIPQSRLEELKTKLDLGMKINNTSSSL